MKGVLKMPNFLKTLKYQFIADSNTNLIDSYKTVEEHLNSTSGIIMRVCYDYEKKDIESIEFTGI